MLETLVTSIATSAAVAAFGWWLARTLIHERLKHDYKEELSEFEATLKSAADTSLEHLRTTLRKETEESLERLRINLQSAASWQAQITSEARKVIHDGIAKAASATHSMCWLTWLAGVSPKRITEERVGLYDGEMHVLLPEIMSFEVLLVSYSPDVAGRFGELLSKIEDLDARIGEACIHLLDGDSGSIAALQMYHAEATGLHLELKSLCSAVPMMKLFNVA